MDQAGAAAAAKRCKGRVEVLSGRSQTRQVFVNANGSTTIETSLVPARVQRKDGSWASVDATLTASGGSWVPKASTMDVAFSNGGPGPFATYRSGGQTLTLSWPLGSLPAPSVSGSSLVYRDVLAGVDLWVTVSGTSFRPVLAVADAKSAANPALQAVAYRIGGSVHAASTPDGRVRFADSANKTVAVSDSATMWDASISTAAGGAAAAGGASQGARAADATGSTATATSDARRAGDFAKVARVGLSTGGKDLTVRPDAAMLASPTTHWPVYIDPAISPSQTRYAYADSCNTNNDVTNARVGLDPTDGCRYRSYFTLPVTQGAFGWMGKQVLSAEFDIELDHSWACTDTPAWVYNTGPITATPRMPWSGAGSAPMPASGGVSASGHANEAGGCGVPDQGDMLMRFSGQAFLDQVRSASNQNWPDFTIGLCTCDPSGGSESTGSYWKRFYIDNRAVLIVSYDTVPGMPANLTTSGAACGSAIGTTSPTIAAQAVDGDGNDTLSALFQWQQVGSSTMDTATRTQIPANIPTSVDLTLGAGAAGQTFQWRVQTTDSSGYPSPWTPWCTFSIVAAVPNLPSVDPFGSPSYAACDPAGIGSCPQDGAPGLPGTFTLGPNGSANITSYTYGWSNPPTTTVTVAAGATTNITVTPPHYGLNTLYVGSSNGVKSSGVRPYQFLVDGQNKTAAVSYLPLDDINGHNFTDQVSQVAATAGSGVSWLANARYEGAKAANFNGDPASGAVTATVSTLDTSKSFSVAAWVKPSSIASGNHTAVSKDGTSSSGFSLGQKSTGSPSAPHWAFTVTTSDGGSGVTVAAPDTLGSGNVNKWVYLVGSYDAAQKSASLYVNGKLAGSQAVTGSFVATGPLTIGRARSGGAPSEGWSGQIADVRAWTRVLTDEDLNGTDAAPALGVPDMAGLMAPVQVGTWDFADVGDCFCVGPSVDGSFFGHNLYLSSGWDDADPSASFTFDSHNGNGGFTGNGGYASTTDPDTGTAQPVVRTDQSFTVSAWVKVNETDEGNWTAVGQDGTTVSGFFLQYNYFYRNTPGWCFMVPNSDTVEPDRSQACQIGATTDWTHLVGVYDAEHGTTTLYVNGVFGSSADQAAPFQANGALTIGRSLWSGEQADSFWGMVDEVNVWQGAMSAREVADMYRQTTTDITPPTVVTTTPAAAATAVPTGTNVKVKFSEPVLASTINGTNVTLTGPGGVPVPGMLTYVPSITSAVIVPTIALSTNTQYTVDVKGDIAGVTDSAGNALGSDLVYTFTTAGGAVVIGDNAVGDEEDWGNRNWLTASRFTVGPAQMSITQMTVFVGDLSGSPNNKYQLAIYTDNNGSPGTLVASSTSGTLTNPYSWYSRPVTATLAANTSYWLVYNTNGDNLPFYDQGLPGRGAASVDGHNFGSWPASFGSSDLVSQEYSIYAH